MVVVGESCFVLKGIEPNQKSQTRSLARVRAGRALGLLIGVSSSLSLREKLLGKYQRMISVIPASEIPSVTTKEMIEVDRAMMEDYRIDLPRMMENAGRSLAELARSQFLRGSGSDRHVLVLAGSGGNGGGALVAARHLSNWGAKVTVFLAQSRGAMTSVPAHQLSILGELGLDIIGPANVEARQEEFDSADVILDGLIGYSLKGAPYGPAAQLIAQANKSLAVTIALDAPSGVDANSGTVFDPAIEAAATMTLALPKTGLLNADLRRNIGELYCADISVPPALYSRFLSKTVPPIYADSGILRVDFS